MTRDQIAKVLLKVGLSVLVPHIGGVIVAAAEGFGGLLIDDHTSTEAKRISARVLGQLEKGFVQFLTVEGLDERYAEALFERASRLIEKFPPSGREWVEGKFDPQRAADAYLRMVEPSMANWDAEERRLIASIIAQYHLVLAGERDIVQKFELEFRQSVMSQLANTPAAVLQAFAEQNDRDKLTAAAALISIPRQRWRPGISPPGALLRADNELAVPFHGRERDLDELMSWTSGPEAIRVRLITGAGGMGKTRLLIEACNRLAGDGWRCGFLDNRAALIAEGAFGFLVSSGSLFVVIDYAETRRQEVCLLLREAFAARSDSRLRFVLLARSRGDWWDHLRMEQNGVSDILSGSATSWNPLRPLAPNVEERKRSFAIALQHFAASMGRSVKHSEPDDLESEVYSGALILHMKALAEVEGVPVTGEIGILDYILRREQHFWELRARSFSLADHLFRGVSQAIAVSTLNGGIKTQGEAADLFRQIRRLHDQPESIIATISDLLHEMYPGDDWIDPLRPDLLGEHLVSTELSEGDDEILNIILTSN